MQRLAVLKCLAVVKETGSVVDMVVEELVMLEELQISLLEA